MSEAKNTRNSSECAAGRAEKEKVKRKREPRRGREAALPHKVAGPMLLLAILVRIIESV